jgi:hypothetical protein
MAVVPKPRASTRGKAAARPPTEVPPSNLWALIFAVVDSNDRTRNSIRLGILAIIGGCVLVYTWVVATRGAHVHLDHLRVPVRGGVFGYVVTTITGATATYTVTAVRSVRARRRAAAAVDPPTGERSPDQSHTPVPPAGTPGQP